MVPVIMHAAAARVQPASTRQLRSLWAAEYRAISSAIVATGEANSAATSQTASTGNGYRRRHHKAATAGANTAITTR